MPEPTPDHAALTALLPAELMPGLPFMRPIKTVNPMAKMTLAPIQSHSCAHGLTWTTPA